MLSKQTRSQLVVWVLGLQRYQTALNEAVVGAALAAAPLVSPGLCPGRAVAGSAGTEEEVRWVSTTQQKMAPKTKQNKIKKTKTKTPRHWRLLAE